MARKKKWIAAGVLLLLILVAGYGMARKSLKVELSGTYKTDHATDSLPEEFTFQDGYCNLEGYTCTYEYKDGNLCFFWGNTPRARFKCTINGDKLILGSAGNTVTYYKKKGT